MIVECAWCGCIVGEKDGHGLSGITSGICTECFAIICETQDDGPDLPESDGEQPAPPTRVFASSR